MQHMPLDLTDEELATAATPTRRGPVENTAKRYAQLVEKFEAALAERVSGIQ